MVTSVIVLAANATTGAVPQPLPKGEITIPRNNVPDLSGRRVPVSRPAYAVVQFTSEQTLLQQAIQRSVTNVTEHALYEVAGLKRLQQDLEVLVPDATEMLNLITHTGCMALAESLRRFGSKVSA